MPSEFVNALRRLPRRAHCGELLHRDIDAEDVARLFCGVAHTVGTGRSTQARDEAHSGDHRRDQPLAHGGPTLSTPAKPRDRVIGLAIRLVRIMHPFLGNGRRGDAGSYLRPPAQDSH